MAAKENSTIVRRSLDEWKEHCAQIKAATAVNLLETPKEQQARIDRAKKDYNFFVKTYFPNYADADCAEFHIKAAERIVLKPRPADDPNLISVLEWPREHAKSVHADIIMPMWMIVHGKLEGLILMGKNGDDACNLLSDIQAQLQDNELFIHDFGEQYNYGDWQLGDFTTKSGIRFLALGRDQSPRGARKNEKRPNVAVIDDIDDDEIVNNPKRVRKIVERIMGALFFALGIKGSTIIVAGNRIHSNSILANIVGDVKPGAPKRKGIYHSKIVAIDPKTKKPAWWQRYTLAQLQSKIDAAGPAMAGREFFHENHVEGTIFLDRYIKWVRVHKLIEYNAIIGYFDPSFENKPTSDFKAVRVWGIKDNTKHCLKSFVRRCELNDALEFMSRVEDSLPAGIGIIWFVEKQFYNRPIQDAVFEHNEKRKKEGKRALAIIQDDRIKENKYTRIVRMQPDYANGNVGFDENEMYDPDMIEGNNQLKGIEPGYNSPDDAPDADEGAWYYLDMLKQGRDFKPIIGKRSTDKRW